MEFTDFIADRRLATGHRLITEEDLDSFLRLSGLDNPIFLSHEGAALAGHPRRIVPGPFILTMAMGLAQQAGFFDRVVAVLEFKHLKFLRTVHPGDTLTVEAKVLSQRLTSKHGRGLVELSYAVKNQHMETVLTSEAVYLMRP